MKENRYDDPVFFERYAQMSRSQLGLAGAGEWPALEPLFPALAGRRMLDLGCGYGWHCAYALEHGACSVTGVDLSEKMLAVAQAKIADPRATFLRAAIEDVRFPDASFDLVFSSLALHYVADIAAVFQNACRWLAPDGTLLFSCEHPVFTAQGPQDWFYGPDGAISHFPVDRYFEEGARDAVFLGEHVVKYHRTLTTILGAVTSAGFVIERVVEPQPTPESLAAIPGMRDELRRPMMFIVRARKA